jgi:uncharacterized membrane protein YgdD (TMEM256/DUF423 family)
LRFDQTFWRGIAGFNGFLAVAMGAVAAHAIADPQLAALAEKASLYQLIHTLVILYLAERPGKVAYFARWLFLAAIFLFCGSLYLKALSGGAVSTALAPAGGISFMAGWLLLAFSR